MMVDDSMAGRRSRRVVVVEVVCRDGNVRCMRMRLLLAVGEEGLKASLLLILVVVAAIISMAEVAFNENFILFCTF